MTTSDDSPALPPDGFQRALGLLEFDQIKQRLGATTRTVIGAEGANELSPSPDGRDVATRQQETAEARRLMETNGALELGPAEDLRPLVHRALLGGVLRGSELRNFGTLTAAARWNRGTLAHREDLPLLASIAEILPDLPDLGERRQPGNQPHRGTSLTMLLPSWPGCVAIRAPRTRRSTT